jgi:hypothetical protein
MHIILVSDRLATARTISITWRHLITAAAVFSALVLSLSSALSYVSVRHAAEIRLPFLQDLMRAINAEDSERSKTFVRDNLNAMAVKLGEMQAQMTRLDSLGERLAGLAGIKLQELRPAESAAANKPGTGGPLIKAEALSEDELRQALDTLSRQLETRSDTLALLEARLFEERVHKMMLPSTLPVASQWNPSTFGWRIDPFTGERALHEGVDFQAEVGTPIIAAAAGVVCRYRSRPGPDDALRSCLQTAGQAGRVCQARPEDCRSRYDRPVDRPAPAFRGALQGQRPEPQSFPPAGSGKRRQTGAPLKPLRYRRVGPQLNLLAGNRGNVPARVP